MSLQVASEITGVGQINETSIRNIGQWMLTQLESDHVLITQGAQGMTLFGSNGSVTHIPSVSKELGEVTGVADTVGAVLALSLGVDRSKISEAAVLANTAAGIKVGKIGSATVTRDEAGPETRVVKRPFIHPYHRKIGVVDPERRYPVFRT